MADTEEHTFYHGTGVAAANATLKGGARHSYFEEIGARELGRKIRRALLDCVDPHSDEDWRLHFTFPNGQRPLQTTGFRRSRPEAFETSCKPSAS
jgi:hypothetical protein